MAMKIELSRDEIIDRIDKVLIEADSLSLAILYKRVVGGSADVVNATGDPMFVVADEPNWFEKAINRL